VKMRILVPLALPALAALTLAACGGGGGSSDEGQITETIEKVTTTSDPGNCTKLETLSFVEQNGEQKGKAAVRACEEEAEAGKEQAKSVKVSNVDVNGEKATAEVEFEGGSLDSQSLEVALVKEGDDWKLDQIEGFANYDGKALGEAFEEEFKENPEELNEEQAKCIAAKITEASQPQAEELFFSGSPNAIIKLAKGCA
jgi:copper chaperone CopZ